MRVGVVGYLNAWPLTRGLPRSADLEIVEGPPSAIAAGLRDGTFDVGLVPAIELLRQPALRVVPGAAVGAFGRVGSVLLLLRTAPHRVRHLVVDAASRTSQVLAALVLAREYGAHFHWSEAEPLAAWRAGIGDAVLVIGDDALSPLVRDVPTIDLGEAWTRMTGLPFVFAVFAAREAVLDRRPDLPDLVAAARAAGQAEIPAFCREAAARGIGAERDLDVYLRCRIRYALGPLEMAGLARFITEAKTLRFEEMQRDARSEVHPREP